MAEWRATHASRLSQEPIVCHRTTSAGSVASFDRVLLRVEWKARGGHEQGAEGEAQD
jgi:hypothetical protein